MAFPRPGVAISSRAFSRMLDSDIQFPRFVDFVVEKEKNERKRERERERERERGVSSLTMRAAAAPHASCRRNARKNKRRI